MRRRTAQPEVWLSKCEIICAVVNTATCLDRWKGRLSDVGVSLEAKSLSSWRLYTKPMQASTQNGNEGPLLEVSKIRIIIFRGLYWGPPI